MTSRPATRSSSPRPTTMAAWPRGSSWPPTVTWSSSTSSFTPTRCSTSTTWPPSCPRAAPGGRVRVGVQRRRHRRRRRPGVPDGPRGRRAGLDRRRPLRRPRADRRARDRRRRPDLLALQVLRPAPGHGLRQGRGDLETGAPTRRARPRATRWAAASTPARSPYELLAGFNATIDYLDSIGGFDTIVPYERSLGEHFLASIPDTVTVYGLPTMEGRVPTFLVNVEGVAAADVAAHAGGARTSACGPTTRGTR